MIVRIIFLMSSAALATSFFLRREVRFSEVSAQFYNKSVGEVIDFSIQQYHGQHQLTMHMIRSMPMSPDAVVIDIIKCKEYYIDCVNYHSWKLNEFCKMTDVNMMFVNIHKISKNSMKCPLLGEVIIQNMTLNADLLMSTLSNSLTVPWWEHYWITKSTILANDEKPYFKAQMKFYFLSVSVFQNERKKNNTKHTRL